MEIIYKILRSRVPDREVRVFGSRVSGTVKKYSDIDIVVIGKTKLSENVLYSLKEDFRESDLPFRVDVLDWNGISKKFQRIIEKKYEVIQKSENNNYTIPR